MADEFPTQDYYPSWRAIIRVRLEEYADNETLKKDAPAKPTKNLKGVDDKSAPLQAVPDPEAPEGVKRLLLVPATGKGSSTKMKPPPAANINSSDKLTHRIDVIPKSAEWGQNGFRVADTLKMELRFIDVPFDPRCVRAAGVEFYLGTVDAEDYARGIRGETLDGRAMNLLPFEYIDEYERKRTNLRFTGWVDKWEMQFRDEGEPIVSIECRDNTQLFIDTEVPPKLSIATGKPIDEAVAQYLAHFPLFEGITVEYRGGEPPKLDAALAKTAYPPKIQGMNPTQGAGAGGGDSKLNVWDFLTDVTGALGHILHCEGNNVVIELASTRWSNKVVQRADDPYRPRGEFAARTFIYGRNVGIFKVARSFTKSKPENIEVRCYNPATHQMMVGRYPKKDDFIAMGLPGDGGKDQKWQVIRVRGIGTTEQLEKLAREYYEQIGRQEIEINVATRDLASFGGGNSDPDLLDMRPGDTIDILVRREDDDVEFATVNKVQASMVLLARARLFLEQLGFDEDIAEAYAKVSSAKGFQTSFRVKEMMVRCDAEEGVSFDIKAHNFVEVRADRLGYDDPPPELRTDF